MCPNARQVTAANIHQVNANRPSSRQMERGLRHSHTQKGSKLDPTNYRSISLTAVPCKIMETVVRNLMMDHLLCHNLVSTFQHCFVQKKSCQTNLDIITESSNKGFLTKVVFLVFAKANDDAKPNDDDFANDLHQILPVLRMESHPDRGMESHPNGTTKAGLHPTKPTLFSAS